MNKSRNTYDMEMGSSALIQGIDYFLPKLNFGKIFRRSHKERNVLILTDWPKAETGTISGIFSDDLDISVSFRIPNTSTNFKMEIYAINVAAKEIRNLSLCSSTVDILIYQEFCRS